MCVNQRASIFVAHSSLELIDPDTRIDCKRFPFDSLEPESRQRLRSLKPWKTQRTHGTGRPTGAKRLHRDFTPIFQLQGNKCECISTAMTVTVKCRLTRETRYYVTQIVHTNPFTYAPTDTEIYPIKLITYYAKR